MFSSISLGVGLVLAEWTFLGVWSSSLVVGFVCDSLVGLEGKVQQDFQGCFVFNQGSSVCDHPKELLTGHS